MCLSRERVNEWINEIVGDERTLYMELPVPYPFPLRHVGRINSFCRSGSAYTKDGITHLENVEIKKQNRYRER